MCTLTYLPRKGGFTLTHNRDERQDRPTTDKFQELDIDGDKVYYPKDLEANGSWIAYSEAGRALALLNGGSESYKRKPKYRHSRGLVVLDNFKYSDQQEFYSQYDFEDIEPFTLIIRDREELWKLTHNEHNTSLDQLDAQATGIWSSTTLYTQEVRTKRKEWFYNWLKDRNEVAPELIGQFHKSAGDGDGENDLIMSRWGILKTLSITQIHYDNGITSLSYEDLTKSTIDLRTIGK